MDIVNEGSNWSVEVEFTDENDQPTPPGRVWYGVYDQKSGEELVECTEIEGINSDSFTLVIDPDVNMMVNPYLPTEIRIVTVKAVFGRNSSREEVGQYRYRVKNMAGVES
jgi:hypothetical protein